MRPILRLFSSLLLAAAMPAAAESVERWGVYEIALKGPSAGNPFLDVRLSAHFRYRNRAIDVDGFYDGDGLFRIRFMPDEIGDWSYATSSNVAALDGKSGAFTAVAPSASNHGPVRVRYTTHFGYEDGSPYTPIGTTCYAWTHQGDRLEEQTLATLRTAPFNKMRMCVFPKSYQYNANEPVYYLFYFDVNQPAAYEFDLAAGSQYRADLIDPWEMTITPIAGTFTGKALSEN